MLNSELIEDVKIKESIKKGLTSVKEADEQSEESPGLKSEDGHFSTIYESEDETDIDNCDDLNKTTKDGSSFC